MQTSAVTNKKVVLIEDNNLLAGVIAQKLTTAGAEVHVYKNGLEGLAGIRSIEPDLVLLDIMLPIMNGYEVMTVLNTEGLTSKYPVIIVSNSGQPVELDRLLSLGARDYLVKVDFTPEEVLKKAENILHTTTTNDEPNKVSDVVNSELGTATKLPPDASSGAEPIKVFVVEDDPMLRNMLAAKFAKSHCASMFTNDGAQAIDLAQKYEPDVILLDLMLPGKDGFEILDEVKQHGSFPGVPIIVFSNKSEPKDKERVLELGATSYHIKAMTDLNELIAEIRSYRRTTT